MSNIKHIGGFVVDTSVTLGHGTFGVVYQATDKQGKKVAVKCFSIHIKEIDTEKAEEEVEILKEHDSDYIIRLIDSKSSEDSFWLFMEMCDLGDLESYYVHRCPQRAEWLSFMCDMAAGLKFLHKNKIAHRDIKPANILICSTSGQFPIAKISDFGLSKVIDASTNEEFCLQFTSTCGTPLFMAPELFTPNVRRDESVDIFAMGLTFLAMVSFKEGQKKLVPSSDSGSANGLGSYMHSMTMFGSTEEAVEYSQKAVDIPDGCYMAERRIRKLVRKMITYRPEDRLNSAAVRKKVKQICYDNLEEVEPKTTIAPSGGKEPAESVEDDEINMTAVQKIGSFDIDTSAQLGHGFSSVVYKARNNITKHLLAAKHASIDEANAPSLRAEFDQLKTLSFPYLAQLVDYAISDNSMWLFVELCDFGDLETYFLTRSPGQPEMAKLMSHMAAGVNYLHERGVIHMDIKPKNVLVDSSTSDEFPRAKITDFGQLKILHSGNDTVSEARNFAAPEIFAKPDYSTSADIFSLGLTFFSMVCFKRGEYKKLIPADNPTVSMAVGQFMCSMAQFGQIGQAREFHKTTVAAKKGSTRTESQVRELVKKMILYESSGRISSAEVLEEINRINQ